MNPNAASRKDVRAQEKAAKVTETMTREVIAGIMSTTNGRWWIWNVLSSCHVFETSFTTDPMLTAFREGERSLGLSLLGTIMAHCPDQYVQAAREYNERSTLSEQRRSPIPNGGDTEPSDTFADGSDDSADYDPYAAQQ